MIRQKKQKPRTIEIVSLHFNSEEKQRSVSKTPHILDQRRACVVNFVSNSYSCGRFLFSAESLPARKQGTGQDNKSSSSGEFQSRRRGIALSICAVCSCREAV